MKVSARLNTIIQYAREEAMRTGCLSISTDHLLLAILRESDNDACRTLSDMGVDIGELKAAVEAQLFQSRIISYDQASSIGMARSAQNTLNLSVVEASIAGSAELNPCHLLLAISNSSPAACQTYFKSLGLDHSALKNHMRSKSYLSCQEVSSEPPASFSHFLKIISSPESVS